MGKEESWTSGWQLKNTTAIKSMCSTATKKITYNLMWKTHIITQTFTESSQDFIGIISSHWEIENKRPKKSHCVKPALQGVKSMLWPRNQLLYNRSHRHRGGSKSKAWKSVCLQAVCRALKITHSSDKVPDFVCVYVLEGAKMSDVNI